MHPAMMTMIHDIDLAVWISGSRATSVTAHGRGGDGERPLVVWAQVKAANGTVWSLRTAWVLPDGATPIDRFEVYGAVGTHEVTVHQRAPGRGRPTVSGGKHARRDPLTTALEAEIAHFCSCLRRRAPSEIVPLGDAEHGLAVAQAIVASAAADGVTTEVLT
jgi:predicted dehydrogenase